MHTHAQSDKIKQIPKTLDCRHVIKIVGIFLLNYDLLREVIISRTIRPIGNGTSGIDTICWYVDH